MADTYLSVVDSEDFVIGRHLRSVIHAKGLRHREVHVWFVTPKNELVCQRRSKSKDTYPGYLDATVGGHVEEGQDYMSAALAEVSEEAGLEVKRFALTPLAKIDVTQVDTAKGVVNTVFRMVYLMKFAGELSDLKIEAGDGAGFEIVPLAEVFARTGEKIGQMIPGFFEPSYAPAWQAMRDALRI